MLVKRLHRSTRMVGYVVVVALGRDELAASLAPLSSASFLESAYLTLVGRRAVPARVSA